MFPYRRYLRPDLNFTTLGTILLAVMVVFAGCGGVLGSDSDEPKVTFTPAPVPTAKPTLTPVPQLAPGLTRQGIENASALVAAHTSFLVNRSFITKSNYTALAPNGSVVLRGESTLRVGPPGKGVYSVSKRNTNYVNPNYKFPVRTEVWWNDKRLYSKRTYANGTTTYDLYRQERYGTSGAGLRYRLKPFGTANTSVVKRFSENGTTLYHVRGTTRTDRIFMGENASIRLQLLVDSRGVIHEYRIVRRLSSEKNVSTVIYEVQFSKIGATDAPERPSWVDEAMNQTTTIPEQRRRYDEPGNGTETNETLSKTTTG